MILFLLDEWLKKARCFVSWRSVVLLALTVPATAWSQSADLISRMAANEVAARQQRAHFAYMSEERSTRTGDRLWKEKVVETADGPLRRLIAIDGRALTAGETEAERRRIDSLVAHPDDFRSMNRAHKDDEDQATRLLQMLPKAFVLSEDGEMNGCNRIRFRPDPAFQPSTYQERVAHEMEGSISVKQPEDRLCSLEATIMHPVEFGFGVLGRIDQGGHFSLERKEFDPANWKTDRISVHVNGRILLLKSLAQSQEIVRTEIRVAPQNLSLVQAAQMIRE
ncbi:MAG TPA: hypothetical protein VNU92_05410 [Edaphobacter sp.]|jgi:hypothetical protein|nr:hypothetical protein [Edaphobacter sp.]